MKVLITESQKEKVLRNLIKNNGVEFASNIVGGIENLLSILDIESPMDFLHIFDDLNIFQSEKNPNRTLFRYKPTENIIVYDRNYENVYICYDEIWSVLAYHFGLNYPETQQLTKMWLDEVYNLRGVTTNTLHKLK